jgi:hypothetical protein
VHARNLAQNSAQIATTSILKMAKWKSMGVARTIRKPRRSAYGKANRSLCVELFFLVVVDSRCSLAFQSTELTT